MNSRAPLVSILLAYSASALTGQTNHAIAKTSVDRVISGVVLSATTGQTIASATVSLGDSNGGPFRADTTTDGEGRFVFPHLYEGKFALRAAHRGYIASGFDEHEGYFTGIVTGDGLVSTDLKFLLPPQAIINGIVSDDAGDAAAKAAVRLYRQDDSTGKEKITLYRQTTSDDLGNYEFSDIAAGTYFLVVTATPWYVSRPQVMLRPGETPAPSPLDVVFATTYYPDATDDESATPIPVKAGDRIPINFTLHAQPAVHITLKLPNPEPGHPQPMPLLRTRIFGSPEYVQQGATASSDNATSFDLGGVAPGSYQVELSRGDGQASVTSVDANSGSVAVDPSQVVQLASVDGSMAMDDGSILPAHIGLSLAPETGQPVFGGVGPNGSFQFRSVPPGDYRLVVMTAKGPLSIKQLAATGATTDRSTIKIGSSPVTLAAVVSESETSIHGFAKRDGKPGSGVMIVLVPADGAAESFRRDQSDSDGSFVLRQALPGHYTLVAIEDGWGLEWARPEVMTRYLAQGLKLMILPHGKSVELKDPLLVQQK